MNSPNQTAERIARSTVAEGWARLSMMALVPISIGLGGWIGVSLIDQGERLAIVEQRIRTAESVAEANAETIRALTQRALASDTSMARLEERMVGIAETLRRIEERMDRRGSVDGGTVR